MPPLGRSGSSETSAKNVATSSSSASSKLFDVADNEETTTFLSASPSSRSSKKIIPSMSSKSTTMRNVTPGIQSEKSVTLKSTMSGVSHMSKKSATSSKSSTPSASFKNSESSDASIIKSSASKRSVLSQISRATSEQPAVSILSKNSTMSKKSQKSKSSAAFDVEMESTVSRFDEETETERLESASNKVSRNTSDVSSKSKSISLHSCAVSCEKEIAIAKTKSGVIEQCPSTVLTKDLVLSKTHSIVVEPNPSIVNVQSTKSNKSAVSIKSVKSNKSKESGKTSVSNSKAEAVVTNHKGAKVVSEDEVVHAEQSGTTFIDIQTQQVDKGESSQSITGALLAAFNGTVECASAAVAATSKASPFKGLSSASVAATSIASQLKGFSGQACTKPEFIEVSISKNSAAEPDQSSTQSKVSIADSQTDNAAVLRNDMANVMKLALIAQYQDLCKKYSEAEARKIFLTILEYKRNQYRQAIDREADSSNQDDFNPYEWTLVLIDDVTESLHKEIKESRQGGSTLASGTKLDTETVQSISEFVSSKEGEQKEFATECETNKIIFHAYESLRQEQSSEDKTSGEPKEKQTNNNVVESNLEQMVRGIVRNNSQVETNEKESISCTSGGKYNRCLQKLIFLHHMIINGWKLFDLLDDIKRDIGLIPTKRIREEVTKSYSGSLTADEEIGSSNSNPTTSNNVDQEIEQIVELIADSAVRHVDTDRSSSSNARASDTPYSPVSDFYKKCTTFTESTMVQFTDALGKCRATETCSNPLGCVSNLWGRAVVTPAQNCATDTTKGLLDAWLQCTGEPEESQNARKVKRDRYGKQTGAKTSKFTIHRLPNVVSKEISKESCEASSSSNSESKEVECRETESDNVEQINEKDPAREVTSEEIDVHEATSHMTSDSKSLSKNSINTREVKRKE